MKQKVWVWTGLLLLGIAAGSLLKLNLLEADSPAQEEPTLIDQMEQWFWRPTARDKFAALPPDKNIFVPVKGVSVRYIADTFGAPRSGGRSHEGQDIFAKKGTPIFSATQGVVTRIGNSELGGNYVYVVGKGGRRFYYAHLDRWADGLEEDQVVSTSTLLGYVGNTGNAVNTPSHLHFGVYGSRMSDDPRVINPLELLVDRNRSAATKK